MIVAVVIVFVSVGAYFFKDKESKNKSEISVEVTNVSNEQLTDNWKTFINSHDGYSFKYPEKMGSPVILLEWHLILPPSIFLMVR